MSEQNTKPATAPAVASSDWLARFIVELDEKQRSIEDASLIAPNKEARTFGLAMASIFEGVKKCAIRASANK